MDIGERRAREIVECAGALAYGLGELSRLLEEAYSEPGSREALDEWLSEGYPFNESLDEVAYSVKAWAENLQAAVSPGPEIVVIDLTGNQGIAASLSPEGLERLLAKLIEVKERRMG